MYTVLPILESYFGVANMQEALENPPVRRCAAVNREKISSSSKHSVT